MDPDRQIDQMILDMERALGRASLGIDGRPSETEFFRKVLETTHGIVPSDVATDSIWDFIQSQLAVVSPTSELSFTSQEGSRAEKILGTMEGTSREVSLERPHTWESEQGVSPTRGANANPHWTIPRWLTRLLALPGSALPVWAAAAALFIVLLPIAMWIEAPPNNESVITRSVEVSQRVVGKSARVSFYPGTSEFELRSFLLAIDANIVEGPTSLGDYLIVLTDSAISFDGLRERFPILMTCKELETDIKIAPE